MQPTMMRTRTKYVLVVSEVDRLGGGDEAYEVIRSRARFTFTNRQKANAAKAEAERHGFDAEIREVEALR